MTTEMIELIPLTHLRRHLPSWITLPTLYSWANRGVAGTKLRSCILAGRRVSSITWLRDFLEEVSNTKERELSLSGARK